MMRAIFYILAVLSALVAQAIPLEQLASVSGMTNNKINVIHRGSDGFMWFGTVAGLCRYDGYDHDLYYINENGQTPSGENDIDDIAEDAEGRLWLSSHKVYYIYNPVTDRIEHSADSLLRACGVEGRARAVEIDSHKGLWVYAEDPDGVYHLEAGRDKARRVESADGQAFPAAEVSDFAETPYGMAAVTVRGDIWLIDPSTRRVTEHIGGIANDTKGGPDMVYTTMYDRDGLLWVYNTERLWVLDLPHRQWVSDRLPSGGRDMVVKVVVQDNQGRVWVGRDHHGLELATKRSGRIVFTEMLDGVDFPETCSVTSVCDDGSGTLWVGTFKRGVFYHNDTMRKFSLARGSDVNCLLPRADGRVWVGTDGRGIGVFDPATEAISYVGPDGDNDSRVAVTSMLEMDDGTLYVGRFSRGLQRMRGGRIERVVTGTPLDSTYTWAITRGENNDIWLGTLDAGLFRYDTSTGTVTEYNTANAHMPSDCVISLATASDGTLYIGTAYGVGLIERGKHDVTFLEGFDPGTVMDLLVDSRGLLWVASHRGIKVYDPHYGRMHDIPFRQTKGASYVIGIEEDKGGAIWATEGGRLINLNVEYDASTGKLVTSDRSYDHRDGLQNSDFNQRSFAMLPSGEMLVGGLYGINRFTPARIRLNSMAPRVMFTSLRIDGKNVSPGEDVKGRTVLGGALNHSRRVDLSPGVRDFTVSFASDNYVLPEKTVYMYMLQGFNDTWLTTEPGVNHVTYTNLSPGSYKLLVKAVNNDGFESDEASTLDIVVHEPFYWTVWARIIYLILLLAGIYGIYLLVRRRERKRFNERRRADALKKEEELNQMKFRFITNVSHDLRTPLTLIMSPLDAMIKEGGDERRMKRLGLMRKNADQLLGMVNQLLDFRKSEVSGLTLKANDGELVSFLENVCSSFGGFSGGKGIRFKFAPEVKRVYMRFDEEKMYKVMMNLVSNAYKFTPADGSVTVGVRLAGDDRVVISVADTGIGVSDEDKKRIFERFYQGHASTADPAATGYGIGLSLVHDYVTLHGGSVDVRDNHPAGTVFEVTLPVVKCLNATAEALPEAVVKKPEESRKSKTEPAVEAPAKPTALVVDDNQDMLEFLKDGLSGDFHVVAVGSGDEALKLLESLKPSIIVTDIMMPGVDGVELSRRVKSDKKLGSIPVIVLSAKSGEDAKVEMLTLGVEDYITKPFNIELLVLRMKRLVALTSGSRGSRLIDPEPESIPITPLDEKMVEKAVKYVVTHLKRPDLSVEELSSQLGMSRVHLYKKLKATTGKTPIEFIRLIRLKRAAQLLRESQLNVSEVAYQVGFNSPRNFSKYFRDEFGMLPSAYQEAKEQATIHPL